MADALNVKANIAAAIASGNLEQDVPVTSEKDTLGNALRDMIEGLGHLIRQVNEAALQVASPAAQVSEASHSLSEGTTEQAVHPLSRPPTP